MSEANKAPAPVHGTVRPGFEAVEQEFRRNFSERGELGAACAIYYQGQQVVDLWGGCRDSATGAPWEADTLVLVFSTTKGLAAMTLAVAHARGWLHYDEPVATYWPEFAQGGKATVTVRQLLAHQAGLCAIDTPLDVTVLADLDRVAAIIARQQPAWTPGTRHGYHGLSLGWYAGELVRRVDPQHRSLGRFFHEELAQPLGAEFYIGLPPSVPAARVARIQAFQPLQMLTHLHTLPAGMVLSYLVPGSLTARTFGNPRVGTPGEFDSPAYRAIEFPSGGGIGQVRAIARAYSAFATGGQELGLTAETLASLTERATPPSRGSRDVVLKVDTNYAVGFLKPSPAFSFGSPQAFGTMGAGGSFGFADPTTQTGFAYAPNKMGFHLWDDPREHALRAAFYRCIGASTLSVRNGAPVSMLSR